MQVEEESDETSEDDAEEEPDMEIYREQLEVVPSMQNLVSVTSKPMVSNHQSVRLVSRDPDNSNLLLEKID